MKTISAVAVCIIMLSAPVVFSQQGQGAGATMDTRVDAQANFIQGDTTSIQRRQFIGAIPGTVATPGPFPMFPPEGGKWQMYRPVTYRTLSMEEIGSMKRKFGTRDLWPGNWKSRVRSTVILKDAIQPNSDPIQLIDWWPKVISYESDRILAIVTVIGDFLQPEELYLGLGLDEAKRISGTKRVAIRVREIREGVTRGRSLGVGGSGGQITADDGSAAAYALGGMVGTNRVRSEEKIFFEILCLNSGPTEAPKAPAQAKP